MGNENSKNGELTENGNIPGKHSNGSVNGLSANITSNGLEIAVNTETIVQQNGEPLSLELATKSTQPEILETIIHKKEVKKGNEDQTDVSLPATNPQPEAANLKRASLTVPESVTLEPGPEKEKAPESDKGEDSNPEENPVMNFFKTLVTPKITKKETATPGATKDQVAQVSEPPAASKGMSYPPPPPPEPPRMEIKGEPAAKPVKPTPKEEPKAAAKEAESPKGKSTRVALSKFFRPKTIKDAPAQPSVEVQETPVVPQPVVVVEVQSENNVGPHETAEEVAQPVVEEKVVEEVPQPVVEAEKVDPSKAGTLEAAAKPEPPPPVQEEKKTQKSSFFSLFKPKVLLDNMTTKVQAASTSGVRLLRRTTGVAADPQKASPAPAAAAETVKAKEEPKAAAKSSEAVVDNKPASVASQAGDDAANVPRKLEKRNSIHLFFKHLSQKRNSTDAGVQTEPVPVAPAAEKAK
ncbi:breast carcinoma-amplified sequence 1 isoform X4 [Sander lucioperca]|uniref:breast carcinoma-amplified sequence 1 isoform X4 n=1 Tax=Sander lucioperca TaxID=283035 RepID=UPI0016534404|nr:breast carcinoma-amplified sequence 1 isoform X4 [Sander lucioperca]